MLQKILAEGNNNPYLSGEEVLPQIEKNSPEYQEVEFHFNTLINDVSQKSNQTEQKIYGIDSAVSLKNQYISLNFEKREQNEITSYGWYMPDDLLRNYVRHQHGKIYQKRTASHAAQYPCHYHLSQSARNHLHP